MIYPMKKPQALIRPVSFLVMLLISHSLTQATQLAPEPVTPGAIPEVHAVLDFLKSISGKHTLTGQHNYPNTQSRNSEFLETYTDHYPAIFSTDWGFAVDGDTDSYLARPDIVKEAIRQHQQGALVTICWHAVPPTADEPITFRPLPGADPANLQSVQGALLDEQFEAVLTPGTELHARWCKQVDAIVVFLKQLEAARVPVLWRPYHEMNGDWFWWGGRSGEYSTVRLYRQLFDRLVNHHQLKNLIWVWNVDRLSGNASRAYELYYPGDAFLDIVSLDVYRNDFAQEYYDLLEAYAGEKVMLFGEVGNPPAMEVYETQPKWVSYVTWAGMVRNTSQKQYHALYESDRLLNLDSQTYLDLINPFRQRMGLPPLEPPAKAPADLTGGWRYHESMSKLDAQGSSRSPTALNILQRSGEITIETTQWVEWEGAQSNTEVFKTDGTAFESTYWDRPMITEVRWIDGGQKLEKLSRVRFLQGGAEVESTTREVWHLRSGGKELVIDQQSTSPWGNRSVQLVYDRIE